jgi:hypothetical protein
MLIDLNQTKVLKRIIIALYALVFGFLLLNRVFLIFDYTTDLGGIEQVFTYYILLVIQHLELYTAWHEIPFANNQYGFIYFELLGRICSSNDPIDINRLARFINLLFNLGTAFVALKIFTTLYKPSKLESVIVFFAVFLSFQNLHFATRPDSLKSLLVLCMLFLFLNIVKHKERIIYPVTFILVSATAVFTKQDAIIVFVLLSGIGIIFFNRKSWLMITSSSSLVFVCLFFAANAYYGKHFYDNILLPSSFNFNVHYFYLAIFKQYFHWFIFIVLSILLYYKSAQHNAKKIALFLGLWFIGTIFVSLKWGAAPNYFQEIVIVCVLLIIALGMQEQSKVIKNLFFVLPLLFLLSDVLIGNIKVYHRDESMENKAIYEDYLKAGALVEKHANQANYYLLTYEKYLCNLYPKHCLFPSYESNMPEELVKSKAYYFPGAESKKIFPNSPDVKGMLSAENLMSKVDDQELFLVCAKKVPIHSMFSIALNQTELIDSSQFFYLYRKPSIQTP